MTEVLLNFNTHEGSEPLSYWPYSRDEFESWCHEFQKTANGQAALQDLSKIAPIDLYHPATFRIVFACFCASRYRHEDDRKRIERNRNQVEKANERHKAIRMVRKAIKETLPLGIHTHPPYAPGDAAAKKQAVTDGSHTRIDMDILDRLLLDFDERLKHFESCATSHRYGCLHYPTPLEQGKGSNRKPKAETMLMFNLTLLFRLWPQRPSFWQPMLKTGMPRYPLTAKLVIATFPPSDAEDDGQIIDAYTVQNRLKALPPTIKFGGW